MEKYRTCGNSIEAVEVDGETDAFIVRNGKRERKINVGIIYHDSWEKAHAYLLEQAEDKVRQRVRMLAEANAELVAVQSMVAPAPRCAPR